MVALRYLPYPKAVSKAVDARVGTTVGADKATNTGQPVTSACFGMPMQAGHGRKVSTTSV